MYTKYAPGGYFVPHAQTYKILNRFAIQGHIWAVDQMVQANSYLDISQRQFWVNPTRTDFV